MILRCPVCRADNTAPPACRRCKADLSMLWTVETERADRLARAAAAAWCGNLDDALEELEMAAELRQDQDVQRMKACVHLLAGDYESALEGYETTKRER